VALRGDALGNSKTGGLRVACFVSGHTQKAKTGVTSCNTFEYSA